MHHCVGTLLYAYVIVRDHNLLARLRAHPEESGRILYKQKHCHSTAAIDYTPKTMDGNTRIHIHTYVSSTYVVNAMEAHLVHIHHQTLQGNDSSCLPHYPDTEEPERQAGYICFLVYQEMHSLYTIPAPSQCNSSSLLWLETDCIVRIFLGSFSLSYLQWNLCIKDMM